MPRGIDIRQRIAASKFHGTPAQFAATYGSDVAYRTTYVARAAGMWDTHYTYTVHADRELAHQRQNKGDNSIRLVVTD